MLRTGDAYTEEREQALGQALAGVAGELRLVDPQDYIAFIRLERFGNVAHLVSCATELYFQADTLAFGRSGDADVGWSKAPRVALDMEFSHRGVTAFFRLVLEAESAGIELTYLSFADGRNDPGGNTQRLVEALADARLTRPRRSSRLADLVAMATDSSTETVKPLG